MSVASHRTSQTNNAQVNQLISQQQLKNLSMESVSKDLSEHGGFGAGDSGFPGLDPVGQSGPPMLISPQQILQQQGGNNEFTMGFF